jgi:glycosyltransferase involved in cell wall biosynthesis
MSKTPFFSVIIPTYNRADFLADTIDSVLNQSEKDFEVIIIDDGSTDHTKSLVQSFNDERISYFFQENKERGAARNLGVQKASGDYVYFLDSDDLLFKNHLAEARRKLLQSPCDFYFQPYCLKDIHTGKTRNVTVPKSSPGIALAKTGNFMSCHGVFLARQFALEHPFNENRELAGSEDYELWLRMAARTQVVCGTKVTSALVDHSARSVFNFNPEKLIKRKTLFLKYIENDEHIIAQFGAYLPHLRAGAFSYIALHLPPGRPFRHLRWSFWLKAVRARKAFIFSKRSLVILRQLALGK